MTPAVFILSYSNLIRYNCSHIVHVCTLYFVHILIIVWGLLNLDIITSTPPLECLHCYLCVICNSNRFHSFIIKVCIMIVHILVMCTGDAGPEQSLVLFSLEKRSRSNNVFSCKCIFFLTMGCSNFKLCWSIGHMMSRVLGNILCDLDPLDLGVKAKLCIFLVMHLLYHWP